MSDLTLWGDMGDEAGVSKSATLSADGAYRYRLGRWWAPGPRVSFIMLNPSTADAEVDDPTIRRCVGFARAWGFGGISVANLYAFRSTAPRGLWMADDPVGPDNDAELRISGRAAGPLIAAWGVNARPDRVAQVLALPGFDRIQCLGVTKDGHPRHPLYLRADAQMNPWSGVAA